MRLAAPVGRLHYAAGERFAEGRFHVTRGAGIAGMLAWLMRLPEPGEAVPVRLVITPTAGGERWVRDFAGRFIATWQRAAGGGIIDERFGLLTLRFCLGVWRGALFFDHVATSLRLWRVAIPLPRWLAPNVCASAAAADGDENGKSQVRIWVRVTLPLVGLLISYEGDLHPSTRKPGAC